MSDATLETIVNRCEALYHDIDFEGYKFYVEGVQVAPDTTQSEVPGFSNTA